MIKNDAAIRAIMAREISRKIKEDESVLADHPRWQRFKDTEEEMERKRQETKHERAMERPGIRKEPKENGVKSISYVLDDLIKAGKTGEGSRGGHIMGHTKSGKPIYGTHHASHEKFTAQDHQDAARHHGVKARAAIEGFISGKKNETAAYKHHNKMMEHHAGEYNKKITKEINTDLKRQGEPSLGHVHERDPRFQEAAHHSAYAAWHSQKNDGSKELRQKHLDAMDKILVTHFPSGQHDAIHKEGHKIFSKIKRTPKEFVPFKKSEGEDMDQLTKLGFTVGDSNLAPIVKSEDEQITEAIKKGGLYDLHRQGVDTSFRERLEKSIQVSSSDEEILKGFSDEDLKKAAIARPSMKKIDIREPQAAEPGQPSIDENLKNTHGEQFHTDNCPHVEELVTTTGEVDSIHDADLEEHRGGMMVRTAAPAKKSLSQEELFIKGTKEVSMPKKEFVIEHKHLGKVLKEGSKEEQKKEGKEQLEELEDVQSKSMSEERTDLKKPDARKACGSEKYKRCVHKVKGKDGGVNPYAVCHASVGKAEKMGGKHAKKSVEDCLDDLIKCDRADKACPPVIDSEIKAKAFGDKLVETVPEKPVKGLDKLHENSPAMNPRNKVSKDANKMITEGAYKSFIKSVGPGGVIFDFGHATGNPMADFATALLNRHGDPTQIANAEYQETSYNKALSEYVKKGETEYMQEATPFGNISKDNAKMLNTSFDQQVVDAYKKGELDNDPASPAIKNDFNKTEINIGGTVIKATSETDAALIRMMKSQMEADTTGGTVVDATAGGALKVVADATSK